MRLLNFSRKNSSSRFCTLHPAYLEGDIAKKNQDSEPGPSTPQVNSRSRTRNTVVVINLTAALFLFIVGLVTRTNAVQGKIVLPPPLAPVAPPEMQQKISVLDDQVKDLAHVLSVLVPAVKQVSDGSKPTVREIGKVMVGKANLRDGPGLQFPSTISVDKGTKLGVVSRTAEWVKVVGPDGRELWLHDSALEKEDL